MARPLRPLAAAVLFMAATVAPARAEAQDTPRHEAKPATLAPATPAKPAAKPEAAATPATLTEDPGVGRARELLARARLLDESATNDDKLATDLAKALPALRAAAKTARDRANRAELASRPEADALVARAEELEAELAVDEVDMVVKRHAAAESRRAARELRLLAVRAVREPAPTAEASSSLCDPPYRYTADGRKIYRIECF